MKWKTATEPARPAGGGVHLWKVDVSVFFEEDSRIASASEKARAERLPGQDVLAFLAATLP